MADNIGYATAVLKAANLPATRTNVDFVANVWIPSEGTKAAFNPLATTTHRPGSTDFNRNGGFPVQNFRTLEDGISATAQTLTNGHYGAILTLMKAGNASMADLAKAVQQSPWGTKQGLIGKLASGSKAEFSSSKAAAPVYGANEVDQGAAANPFSRRIALSQAMLGQAQRTIAGGGKPSTTQWLQDVMLAIHPVAEASAQSTGGTTAPPISPATGDIPQGSGLVAKVLAAAHAEVGKPYVFGSGPDTSSFDCSDLIQYAYKQVGINLPRVTGDQIKVGQPVAWGKFKPGDLIFSHGGGHVVMYVGNGMVIAAPHTGTVVQYQPVSRFRSSFTAARRVVN